jgi:hypothetical protein
MAKERRQHSAVHGIASLLGAINSVAEVELGGGELTPEAKQEALDAVKEATGVIGESNIMTVMENTDDAIELQHQLAEEAERAEAEAEAEQEETD